MVDAEALDSFAMSPGDLKPHQQEAVHNVVRAIIKHKSTTGPQNFLLQHAAGKCRVKEDNRAPPCLTLIVDVQNFDVDDCNHVTTFSCPSLEHCDG